MAKNRDNRVFAATALARVVSSPTFLRMISKLSVGGSTSVFFGSIAVILGLCIINPLASLLVCGAGIGIITLGIAIGLKDAAAPTTELCQGSQCAHAVSQLTQPHSDNFSNKPEFSTSNQPPYNPNNYQAAYFAPPAPATEQPSAPPLETGCRNSLA